MPEDTSKGLPSMPSVVIIAYHLNVGPYYHIYLR